ncbi:hypothetical protein [Pseudooceanicola algae]|uniref:Uncharacterized protein n=1 Tax=Pseudooceanicola algae TaxID=1537215 RepID=A0A418SL88_9RHOB|nr:hypothetical protein [Pseudooceanicola algae]QPM90831.1 hypothetical protein PSAL_020730 [Pseudooceanicola algae]
MIRTICSLLLLPTLAVPVAAQTGSSDNTVVLANEPVNGTVPFLEQLTEAARISGAVFAGIQVQQSDTENIDLRAHIPLSWRGKEICARVVSANGLYEAVNTYRVSDYLGIQEEDETKVAIPFDTQYEEILATAPKDSLAIKISLGSCSSGQSSDTTVAFWNGKDSSRVSLLVNSFRATKVFVYIGDNPQLPTVCEPVEAPARTAYDTLCQMADLPPGERLKLSVFRVRDNGSTSQDEIYLAVPARP